MKATTRKEDRRKGGNDGDDGNKRRRDGRRTGCASEGEDEGGGGKMGGKVEKVGLRSTVRVRCVGKCSDREDASLHHGVLVVLLRSLPGAP